MLLLTVFFLLLLLIGSYIFFNKEIFAPPTVVSLGFIFSTLCCLYNENIWGLDFSATTMWTIVIGVTSFIIGSILAVIVFNVFRGSKIGFSHNMSEIKAINVKTGKTLFIVLFEIATILFLFTELQRITGSVVWLQIVSTYRAQTAFVSPEEYTMRLSGLCRLAIDVSFAASLIYAYIIGNNIAAKIKQPIINWAPIVLYCILSFMQGYRSDMLRLWIAILLVSYILQKRKVGWRNSRDTKKMIRMIALSVLGIAVLFVALRGTVGRSETDWDPIYYLAFYAGSPIAALDLFLKDPLSSSYIWGKETFYNLNLSIAIWFNKPELVYIFYKEFRMSPSGEYIGNVYTALRPPFYDFGFAGMIFVMLGMGIFFTLFYCNIRDSKGKNLIDFRLLVYSYVAYTFFMYFYNLYNNFISFGFLRLILELIVLRWFLIGINIKQGINIGKAVSEKSRF